MSKIAPDLMDFLNMHAPDAEAAPRLRAARAELRALLNCARTLKALHAAMEEPPSPLVACWRDSAGRALAREMARVRDEVLPAYLQIGLAGAPAAMLMRRDLDLAAKAMAEGDVVAMVRVYQSLKEWSL